jgi:hypothetical protein
VQGWGQELAMETLALGLHLLPAGIYRVQPLFRLFLSIFQQRLQPTHEHGSITKREAAEAPKITFDIDKSAFLR